MKYRYLFLFLLFGCKLSFGFFIPDEPHETLTDIRIIMNTTIKYSDVFSLTTKTPEETYNTKSGDCHDMTLLLGYLVTEFLGWENVQIVSCLNPNMELHSVLFYDGKYYEGQTGGEVSIKYTYLTYVPYEVFISMIREGN